MVYEILLILASKYLRAMGDSGSSVRDSAVILASVATPSVESKFWLKLSECTSSSVDISDELLKHGKKVKANAPIAKK